MQNFNPEKMTEIELKKWINELNILPDWIKEKSARTLLDQVTDDQQRVKAGRKMEYIDLLKSGKVVGGINYIRKSNEDDCINRHNAYLLCKQIITALIIGRFCKIDHDDLDWVMDLVEFKLGGHAKHLSKVSE